MFTELWKNLGGSFDKRWLIHAFGPALVFWGAGLWAWAQMTGLDQALATWQGYGAEIQVFLGAGGLLLVFFTAILLESFEGPLLRFYEGYWPRRPRRAQRRAKDLRRKKRRRRTLRAKVAAGQATPAERAELSRLDTELAYRPSNPNTSMPTQLGDVLRAAENYARERYGLDPIVLWPRLFPQLSEPLREALAATQDQLDLALRLATLSGLYGIAWSAVAAARRGWHVLGWTLPALPLAWLLWRSAHQAAISYAGLFRSAFDLHRFDAYRAMHWPKPTSPQEEAAHGKQLTYYLLEGKGAKGIAYAQDQDEDG